MNRESTRGRVEKPLESSLRDMIFGEKLTSQHIDQLDIQTQIDNAHLLMLLECEIVEKCDVTKLLYEIFALRSNRYQPLMGRNPIRGIYFLYEDFLVEKLGEKIAGQLHTARSRNDMKATAFLLEGRKYFIRILQDMIKLSEVLCKHAQCYSDVPMPVYTHYQPALPITYGHYLAALCENLGRQTQRLLGHYTLLMNCPLGAGAVGGTTFPINTEYTAHLLGFEGCFRNSIDAVASRDFLFVLCAEIAMCGNLINRASEDYLLWCTTESSFMELSDEYVGISSMMPNKRNPFLFEQLQGKVGLLSGSFVAALSAAGGAPYTNSIAVGTEAVTVLKPAVENLCQCLTIFTALIKNAKPQSEPMIQSIKKGYTLATEYANMLVRNYQLSFRQAHETVGSYVKEHQDKEYFEDRDTIFFKRKGKEYPVKVLNINEYLQNAAYGGGPATDCVASLTDQLLRENKKRAARLSEILILWESAEKRCEVTVKGLLQEYY